MIGLDVVIAGGAMSIIGTLIIIQRLFTNKIKLMELTKKYQIEMLKLKKREGRKDKQIAAELNINPPRSLVDNLKGLDVSKINSILDMVQGKDYEEVEEEESNPIEKLIRENPQIVNQVLSNLKGGSNQGVSDFEGR